jgi:hypothetical protein
MKNQGLCNIFIREVRFGKRERNLHTNPWLTGRRKDNMGAKSHTELPDAEIAAHGSGYSAIHTDAAPASKRDPETAPP